MNKYELTQAIRDGIQQSKALDRKRNSENLLVVTTAVCFASIGALLFTILKVVL